MNLSNLRFSAAAVTALLQAACAPAPMLEFELDTPLTVLEPVGAPPLYDARSEYRPLFCALLEEDEDCESLLHRLGDEAPRRAAAVALPKPGPFRIMVVPGLFGECISSTLLPFEDAFETLVSQGHDVQTINVGGRSGSRYNARIVDEYFTTTDRNDTRPIVLIGHSKGVADILHTLVEYPEVASRVAAVLGVAGVVNGTPYADGVPDLFKDLFTRIPYGPCPATDGLAIHDLERTYLLTWIAANPLPPEILYVSIGAFAPRDNTSLILRPGYDALARTDPRNDGLIIYSDQIIPGSHLLGFANADHWAVALPFETKSPFLASTVADKNAFPRTAMIEAALIYIGRTLDERKEQE